MKTRGIGAISEALEHEQEVGLSVRGQLRDVVMDLAEFYRLRECELHLALQCSRADLAEGRLVAGICGGPSLAAVSGKGSRRWFCLAIR